MLITAAAVSELEGLARRDVRRRVVQAMVELAAGVPVGDRLTAAGLCRRRGRGFQVLYRLRGSDLVICGLGVETGR